MAVNVPMQNDGYGNIYPVPFQGEVFLLTRDKTRLSFRDSNRNQKQLTGRLFMTNLRMVFSLASPREGLETFEAPFRGIWDERLHQPIFGCNNLTATVQYYDEQPFTGSLTMRIDFIQGGVNTFLPMFNNVLLATRQQMAAENNANPEEMQPVPLAEQTPNPTDYFPDHNTAFIDPSDPSRIYTTQPMPESAPRRTDTPSWSVSGGGLRRRHA